MDPIRVGVIGLGEVAQIVHLPILASRPDLFEIAAVCDVSEGLVTALGERYRAPGRYTDVERLVEHDLDAVMVLVSDEYHADCVVAACRAGRQIFVEKPVCLSLDEAERIIQARDAAGVHVMVGYMRRYAPAFVEATRDVRSWSSINSARFTDIIGVNRLLIDQTSVVLRPADIPVAAIQDRRARADALTTAAIGPSPPDVQRAYRMLCGLASHDTSAMRELLGPPRFVIAARHWRGGTFISMMLDYETFCATLDVGVDDQKRFDARIEVQTDLRGVRVQYNTPYIRHLPTTLTRFETVGEAYHQTLVRPTYTDAYVHELEVFSEMVTTGRQPKTSVEDAVEDLHLFRAVVDALRS